MDYTMLNATILRAIPEGPKIYTLKACLFEEYNSLAEYWVYFENYATIGTGWFCAEGKNNISTNHRPYAVKMTQTGAKRINGIWHVTFIHGYKGLYSRDEEYNFI